MRSMLLLFSVLALSPSHAAPKAPKGMVLVPAGKFLMGSDAGNADESPAHVVDVSGFYMDRTEVTNAAFLAFARKRGAVDALEGPWSRHASEGSELPVRDVSWRDAESYCRWAGKRLPTEAEWEKAARGADGRIYPWGSSWNPGRCRCGLEPQAGPVAVGSYPDGASPYGCLDMAGNVWEWTADWYGEEYYADASRDAVDPQGPEGLPDGRLPALSPGVNLLGSSRQGRESNTRKVIRGGGWAGSLIGRAQYDTRAARRLWSNPSYWSPDVGFRCAQDLR